MRKAGRRALGTAIFAIAALAACAEEKPDDSPAIGLPSRSRRDAAADATSNVLEPVDSGPIDSGPPPDLFCYEPGLVLCFTFDDAIANLVATTPKLEPSQILDVTIADTGKKKKAAHFDTGSAITFTYASLLEMQAATVETWVNRDLVTFGNDTVFDDDARFAMTIEQDGVLRCTTPTATARGGKVDVETWAHVACVFDGTTIKAYVNGAEVASAAGVIGTSSTTGAAIGHDAPSGGEGFAGELDSFRVFNLARGAAQISAAAQN
jgi:hypothetical protein